MKTSLCALVLLLVCLTGKTLRAQNGWIQTQLNASMGYSLHATDTEMFAATGTGVYSTVDNGMPWFSKGPANHYVYDVIKSRQYILAATNDGVYRSSDNGNTWMPTTGSPTLSGTGGTLGPHIFAKNSSYVFVIAWAQGIFRSGDDGQNWQQMHVGQDAVGYQDYAAMATCIGTVGETIIIGRATTSPFGIYSSSDNGNTWAGSLSRSDPIQDQFLCLYNDNGKLFAGGFMGLYLSTDLGNSWTAQYRNTVSPEGKVIGLGIFRDVVSYNQSLVAAVDFTSIQISRDNGKSWSSFSDGLISDWTFAAFAIKPPYIWAITRFFGNAYRRSLTDIVTEVRKNTASLPNEYSLRRNYPNPFNPSTTIRFDIPISSFVTLKVYNIVGQEVATLVNEKREAGRYEVDFNASNLASGMYFYSLTADNFVSTLKFIFIR
jgi:photosystem II stability/assembly factor-like uncharacterized protein